MKKELNIKGFTLAEILISLSVIGIIAAITIPALMQTVEEKAWKAQRNALITRLTNAIVGMPKIAGFGEYKVVEATTTDTGAEAFLIEGLSKVYKMSNICGGGNLKGCNLPEKYYNIKRTEKAFPTSGFSRQGAAFQTVNGESVAVFYNRDCSPTEDIATFAGNVAAWTYLPRVCLNLIYDLNGQKKPNEVGKDIGVITVLYNTQLSVVSPIFYPKEITQTAPFYSKTGITAADLCKNENKDLRLPTIEELISYSINAPLFEINTVNSVWWSNTPYTTGENGKAFRMNVGYSAAYLDDKTKTFGAGCVLE